MANASTGDNIRLNALVLAAGRRGSEDPVARLQGKTHKCLVDLDGQPMIERVIDTLRATGYFDRILVSIEKEDILRELPRVADWLDNGIAEVTPSCANLADSVMAVAETVTDPLPLIITTGDNALHTPTLICEFVAAFLASDADVAMAFTAEDIVTRTIPDSGLAFHRLKDGGFSSCNLYAIRSRTGIEAAEVFRSGGQFGKRHWRIFKSFGLSPFVLYKLKATTGANLIKRIGRNLGIDLEMVLLPYPEGPIDVDNPASFRLAERLLQARRQTSRKDQEDGKFTGAFCRT